MNTTSRVSSHTKTGAKLGSLIIACLLAQASTGWSQVLINAKFKADFQTPGVDGAELRSFTRSDGSSVSLYSWADGSDTGLWSVSKGNRYTPWSSTRLYLDWNNNAYSYTTGSISSDANRSILPHPNQGSYSLTLSWTADTDSLISIAGALRKDAASASNGGVIYYLYHYSAENKTGTELWSSTVTAATTTVIPTNLNTTDISMKAGDSIMFVVASRLVNDTAADRKVYFSTDFAITGHAIPEPSTYALIAFGIGGLFLMRRQKHGAMRKQIAKGMLSAGVLGSMTLSASAGEVKAGFLADFKTHGAGEEGTWSDGSGTGDWSVGFGNRLNPEKNFKIALFDPKIGGTHGAYGFTTRQFINDQARTVVPGASAYSGSAVIRWKARQDSVVFLNGSLHKVVSAGKEGDGIDCYIYQGQKRLWLVKDFVEADTRQFEVKEIAVKAGDSIYLVVSPMSDNNVNDAVFFEEDFSIVGSSVE